MSRRDQPTYSDAIIIPEELSWLNLLNLFQRIAPWTFPWNGKKHLLPSGLRRTLTKNKTERLPIDANMLVVCQHYTKELRQMNSSRNINKKKHNFYVFIILMHRHNSAEACKFISLLPLSYELLYKLCGGGEFAWSDILTQIGLDLPRLTAHRLIKILKQRLKKKGLSTPVAVDDKFHLAEDRESRPDKAKTSATRRLLLLLTIRQDMLNRFMFNNPGLCLKYFSPSTCKLHLYALWPTLDSESKSRFLTERLLPAIKAKITMTDEDFEPTITLGLKNLKEKVVAVIENLAPQAAARVTTHNPLRRTVSTATQTTALAPPPSSPRHNPLGSSSRQRTWLSSESQNPFDL